MNAGFFICEDTCAQKFDVYFSYDIYVTIYVNIYELKNPHIFVLCHICHYIMWLYIVSRRHYRHALYE